MNRRFTGAKGIGRLAAHKLARHIDIDSTPWDPKLPKSAIEGRIDWDRVEEAETLDLIPDDAVQVLERAPELRRPSGTTLTLKKLRAKWTPAQRTKFFLEVESLRAPAILTGVVPTDAVRQRGLFEKPIVVDAPDKDPGFTLSLEGEFQTGDSYWSTLIETAGWLLEIDAGQHEVKYLVVPTEATAKTNPAAKRRAFSEPHPAPNVGPFFHARIFVREGALPSTKAERAWAQRLSGIRLYMEGFRVLPYGDPSDDWLFLGRDTQDRTRRLRFLDESSLTTALPADPDEGLSVLPNKQYLGGVFLTANRAGTLQMLVNREGFVPDAAFENIVMLVRRGIDLSTRIRAAANEGARAQRRSDRSTSKGGEIVHASARHAVRRLEEHVEELRGIAASAPPSVADQLKSAAEHAMHAVEATKEAMPVHSMVLVLASVGTQLASFTHEARRLLSLASDLEAISSELKSGPSDKTHVRRVASAASDLRRALERQAAYLVDIVTPDARRRRSRQIVADAVASAWKFVASSAERRGISFENSVDGEARTPPMFRAELVAIFSNLLTNAVKAAGRDGKIRATSARTPDGGSLIRIENTGVAVDPQEGERWFQPFESTTVDADPVLGQGMGLGLNITRDLVAETNGRISFVSPGRGFSAAVQVELPR